MGGSNSKLCFSLPTVAQFAARPMCTCEPKDEKASSLTLGDELRYKPAKGKNKKWSSTIGTVSGVGSHKLLNKFKTLRCGVGQWQSEGLS